MGAAYPALIPIADPFIGRSKHATHLSTRVASDRGLRSPSPAVYQRYGITFTGGISAASPSVEAAKELMAFLKSPAAIAVMRSQGMEPGE